MKKLSFTSSISGMGIVCFLMYCCTVGFSSCGDDYDDTELRDGVEKLEKRVATLEEWRKSVNTDIRSLQNLVAALENRNYITGVNPVTENDEEVGYTITFQSGNPITIRHGKDGADGKDGKDGATPVIGVAPDADEAYYWTLNGEFLTDAGGNKLPVSGAKGDKGDKGEPGINVLAPQVRVNPSTNEWEISIDGGTEWNSTGVKATGPTGAQGEKGDAIFSGIDATSDPRNVTFTLADGTTRITVPRANVLTVAFDSYDVFLVTSENKTIKVTFEGLKEDTYRALVAELRNEDGTTDRDITTRAATDVTVAEPVFIDGTCGGTTVTINKSVTNGAKAILKVTLIDNNGREFSVSRVIKFEVSDASFSSAVSSENGTVYLDEKGTYNMPQTVAKGVTIEGNGATIRAKANIELTEGISIRNATIDCQESESDRGQSNVLVVTGTGVTFDNVRMTINQATEYGIRVKSSASAIIKNSSFDQTFLSRAIFSETNAVVILENCDFSAKLTYAYNGLGKLTAKNCTFRGWLSGWAQGGTFENCTFEYGSAWIPGTVCYGSTTFKDCTFGKYGHPFFGSDGKPTSNPVSGTDYGYDCWVFSGTSGITITFTGCKYSNGYAFGKEIFLRQSADGQTDPSKIVVDGTEYSDMSEFIVAAGN